MINVHICVHETFITTSAWLTCITLPEQCSLHFHALQCQRGGLGDRGAPSLSINDRADAKNSQLHSRHKGWPLLSAIYVQCIFTFDEVWLAFVDHTSWSPQLSRRKYDQNNWLHLMCGSGAVTILRTCNQMVAITAIPLLLKYFVHQSLESQSL